MPEEQFKFFTFSNAAKLHTSLNPSFFNGTAVEASVADL